MNTQISTKLTAAATALLMNSLLLLGTAHLFGVGIEHQAATGANGLSYLHFARVV